MPLPLPDSPALLVRLHNWIGDVVVGLPALHLLARHGVRLELVGKPWAPALLAAHGWPVHVQPQGLGPRVAQWKALREPVREQGDARLKLGRTPIEALLLATSFSSALECRLAGVRSFGYDTDRRRWLLTRSMPRPQGVHMVEEHWRLACRLLGVDEPAPRDLGLAVAPAALQSADALLAQHGLAGTRFALICPFATGTLKGMSKVWPGFQQLARTLLARGVPVLLCPGPGEEDAAQAGYADCTVLPKVPLGDYAALMQRAALVVANDTGPGHIAAAVGARLVSVLGPTEPLRWAPWGSRVRVVQRPSGWPTIEAVLKQVEPALAG
jgi:heptosyltransferase-2